MQFHRLTFLVFPISILKSAFIYFCAYFKLEFPAASSIQCRRRGAREFQREYPSFTFPVALFEVPRDALSPIITTNILRGSIPSEMIVSQKPSNPRRNSFNPHLLFSSPTLRFPSFSVLFCAMKERRQIKWMS